MGAFSFIAKEAGVPAPAAPTGDSNFPFISHHGELPLAAVGSSCFPFVDANCPLPQALPLQDPLPQQLFDAQNHQVSEQQSQLPEQSQQLQQQSQQQLQEQQKLQQLELERQQQQNEQAQRLDILKGSLGCLYQQPALDIESQARSNRFAALDCMSNQYIGAPPAYNPNLMMNQVQQAAANHMSGMVRMAGAQTMCMRLADAGTTQHQHQQQTWTTQVASFVA